MASSKPPTGPQPQQRSRFAAYLLPGGTEPDPRFTLANERTFLAWIRTSLAFLAGGIAVEAFTGDIFLDAVRGALATMLILLGMLISAGAAVRWLAVERSMRAKKPLPLPLIVPVLAFGGTIVAAVIIFMILKS